MCLSGTKDLGRVGRSGRWWKSRSPFDFENWPKHWENQWNCSQRYVWVWEWLQTWLVLTKRQCDKFCGRSGWISGRTKSGCCIRTMPQLTMPFCSRSFFPINTFKYLNILHICGFSTCDFFLYTKVKSVLKGTQFPSVDEVKAKTAQVLNGLGVDEL